MLHDHSRDSAAAAMSSAAWIPWPRSLALASLGRTSSRSGASLTAQVVELAGFLGRSGDPVVTIGSVGRSDSCLATGARLGRFSVRLHSQANASPLAAGGARPSVAGTIGPVGVDAQRWGRALDDLPRDHQLLDILEARQIEHDSEQDALHDRPQSARPRLALDGLPGDRPERLFRSYTTSWFAYPL